MEIIISITMLVQTLYICHTVRRLSRKNLAETTSVVIREVPNSAMSAMCQSILDETERLKTCEDEKERCSIRNYVKEMTQLLVECNFDIDNQEKFQENMPRQQKEPKQ